MNNYYTLIYLNQELNEKIKGGFFLFAISPHKNVIELYIRNNSEKCRLIFSTNPEETAIFYDSYRPPKKSNVIHFFEKIEGEQIEEIDLAEYDRLLNLQLSGGSRLQFKLFSGNPNVYHIENDTIVDAFKNPGEVKGDQPLEPYAPTFSESVNPEKSTKNQITGFNPLLPRNLLPYVIEQHDVDSMTVDEVKEFTSKITDALLNDPHPRVLKTGDVCLWSEEILDLPNDRTFDTVNGAVLHAYRNAVHLRRLHNRKEKLKQLLERTVSKIESQLKELKQAHKSLERADKYEKYGNLLMAHAHESVDTGTEKIEISDFYEGGDPITIPLKEKRSISGNAEYYYDKAKSSRKFYKEAKRRIPSLKQELELARKRLDELNEIDHLPELEKWMNEHEEDLRKFGYGVDEGEQARSPYRKFKEGKYEIWIGKNAKSNDQLTNLAHKEDIWLHARGVGGSHVVIRMGNQKDYPPKEIILKAAGYAAYYSKAKGMKTAPVMYTKCKYVRKPKGSPPGAVVVEKEEVVMVPPINPTNK